MWVKAKWIDPFFAALDAIAPNRDRSSDGTIGDLAHATGVSGHNPDDTPGVSAERQDADSTPEVRAADAGSNLRSPITMQRVVDAILAYPPDRDRLIYLIFNGWIWSASSGWARRKYTGSDQHRTHVHASGGAHSDTDGRPWPSILNLGDEMLTADERRVIDNTERMVTQLAKGVTLTGVGQAGETVPTVNALYNQVIAMRAVIDAMAAAINAGGGNIDTVVILEAMDAKLAELAVEQRDAVADLGEGGAAQVRADAD